MLGVKLEFDFICGILAKMIAYGYVGHGRSISMELCIGNHNIQKAAIWNENGVNEIN